MFEFSAEEFERLYPAFVLLDGTGLISGRGPSMAVHVRSAQPDRQFLEVFEVLKPVGLSTIDHLLSHRGFLEVRARENDLRFQGLAVLQGRGLLLCVGHAPTSVGQAQAVGLKLADFSPSDAYVTALMLVHIQSALLDETRQAMSELAQARDAALVAARNQAEFLANMSHEIRTPLTGLIGFSDLLSETSDLTPQVRRFADRISVSSRGLASVVNNVLDFSALEARSVSLAPDSVNLEQVIRDIAAVVEGEAERKGLQFTQSLEDVSGVEAMLDAQRFGQVLLNLLSNAVKFTDKGAVSVLAWHDATQERVHIEVADTGPGISSDHRPRLFQRFSRADTRLSRRAGGTGLGLAISKSLVTLMGGEIGVRSEEGQGAVFWFTAHAPLSRQAAGGRAEVAAPRRSLRILVVDDVAMNRDFMVACLARLGHQILEADSGRAAVELSRSRAFDLILIDVHMPQSDGIGAITRIRRGAGPSAAAKIFVFSADVTAENMSACRAAGADDFIAKPVRVADLIARVQSVACCDLPKGVSA